MELLREGNAQCEIVRVLSVPKTTVSDAIRRLKKLDMKAGILDEGESVLLTRPVRVRSSKASPFARSPKVHENKRVRSETCRQLDRRAAFQQWDGDRLYR